MNDRKPVMKRKAVATRAVAKAEPIDLVETSFAEVVGLIEQARQRAYQAVNSELVGLYWHIGEYISAKLAAAEWGEGVVDSLAQHLARTKPGQRGFSRRRTCGACGSSSRPTATADQKALTTGESNCRGPTT